MPAGARLVRDVAWNVLDALVYLGGVTLGDASDLALTLSRAAWKCCGRGCEPRALAAAIAFYTLRWLGVGAGPASVYSRLGVPRQSFHNALNRLLALIGHSPLFKRALYGRVGARVCRLGYSVLWEAYGEGRPPKCRGAVEDWPGPRVPRGALILWRGGALKVRLRVEFDALEVVGLLRDVFADEFFTARDASKILLVSPESASRLLDALADMELLERVEVRGRRLYRVPEERGGKGRGGA